METKTDEKVRLAAEAIKAADALLVTPLPQCRNCCALARPNIVMFGDWSWLGQRTETQQERFTGWLGKLAKSSANLAMIEMGAGSDIPTVIHG